MIECNIIGTGSKGNAVVVNSAILIDCGVPFIALQSVYRSLTMVLLTHSHGDHLSKSTIRRLAQERPTLRFACREWLVAPLIECGVLKGKIDLIHENEGLCYGENRPAVETFNLVHDVPNCGWKVHFPSGESLFYATDTNSLNGIEAKNYDIYMLEANYTEQEIKDRIEQKQANGEYCHEWDVLNNHLSKEKADDWLYQNMGAKSKYIYMHGHIEEN